MFSKQALRRLILPLIIEQFLAVMVGMADIMMVSSAGEAAVSSVALVDLINVLIINIFAALATGGAVVCAQSIGAQNLERANRAANQLLYIVTAAALGIMVLVLFCKAGLLGLLFGQVEPEVMEGAITYFVISALSYPFIAVYNGCAALLRAMGNSKASMCVSAYMNGQNIAGNAVFVFVFHQGVAGVALSSLLSRIAAAGLMLALLHGRRNPVRVSGLLRFRFEPAVMAQILRIGVPNGLENSFFQLGRVLLVSLISTFGTAQTAANAVANNIDNFGVIPGQALGLALITVVGQCVGAGDWDQVRSYTKRLVKLTYLCTWGLNAALLLGLPLILRLYSLTPETQWYAAVLIFIHNGCAMLFWPLAFTMPNALRAAGDVRVPMVISITSMLVVRVGGSYLLGLHFGLGAIGVQVANIATKLGMTVFGYDPFLSVDGALSLSRLVHRAMDLETIYKNCDYITLHVPQTPETKGMFNEDAFHMMKGGVRILNLARGTLVNDDDMLAALDSGKVACYVTDFPNGKILRGKNVVAIPHLGASTPESEENCAVMAAQELKDYLENGNIQNSVNLPTLVQPWSGVSRLCIIHRNAPGAIASITGVLSKDGVNVANMTNKSKKDYAYTVVDVDSRIGESVADTIRALDVVLRVRLLNH